MEHMVRLSLYVYGMMPGETPEGAAGDALRVIQGALAAAGWSSIASVVTEGGDSARTTLTDASQSQNPRGL